MAAVHTGADGHDGFGRRTAGKGDFAARPLQVEDLHADNVAATAALWRFLLDVDLVGEVTAWLRPLDERLDLLLADPRDLTVTGIEDELWLRLVDVPTALAARTFADARRCCWACTTPSARPTRASTASPGAPRSASNPSAAGAAGARVRRRRARDGLPRRPPPRRPRRHGLVDRARPGRARTGRCGLRRRRRHDRAVVRHHVLTPAS